MKGKEKYLGYLNPYNQAKIGICHQSMIYPKRYLINIISMKISHFSRHHLNMKCWQTRILNSVRRFYSC
ncbi:hypothetical protein CS542_04200 [Pedobacter sp. IW39]|nr:hypothetical protein CS542_04200 [Pedobacter sp. IW39]